MKLLPNQVGACYWTVQPRVKRILRTTILFT
jgi:hypothetical protein